MAVLIATANRDFDPTEVVLPWDRLRRAGHEITFATGDGAPSACDPLLLVGPFFGMLGAKRENIALYRALEKAPEFLEPIRYDQARAADFDAIVLPGGHAPKMRQYLESEPLRAAVLDFVRTGKPIASICHGGVVLARTIDPATKKSVVAGRRMTALTKSLERSAYFLTAWRLGRYYRTYPAYVEDEVRAGGALFETGPLIASYASPFVVEDRGWITARWPGDATGFADALVKKLGAARAAA